jgi:LL-diaminopimelate aminotransferase
MRDAFAARLGRIPAYLFRELDEMKAQVRSGLVDLGEGSPDQPTPKPIIAAFQRALRNPANHGYPTYAGKLSARKAVAAWYRRRFGVELDPANEVTMLLGSKEGVGHLIWGTCESGDMVAVSDPAYPVYPNQTRLAGATPAMVPLLPENGFLPDLGWLDRMSDRIKLLCLNYPSNPTAAVAPIEFYREVVALARRRGFYVVNDCVYSELYFGRSRPPSILEVEGAKECCIEFHSLSKTFNMAGWRIGMAVGNPRLVAALLRIKQNTDSGPFGAIQDAAAWALSHGSRLAEANRRLYRRRRDAFCDTLAECGWEVPKPEATFYVWARVPKALKTSEGRDQRPETRSGTESESFWFTKEMLAGCRVLCAPGVGFGATGEGHVRFALVTDEKRLAGAARRIGAWVKGR